jgi:4-amino-4-deoxy-L-arabinose transferase-like glycosyltransferase
VRQAAVPLALAALLAVHFALGLAYVNATPIWQNPDEPAHYNYIEFVAQTGGLPELRPGDWDSALLERLKTGQLQPTDSVASIRYESWQPPLYYLVAAPLYRLGAADLRLLRMFDVLLGGLTLLVAFRIAHVLFGEPALALAVPWTMLGIPMFTAVSAAVSADPLANLLAAVLTLVLLPLSGEARGAQRPLAVGVLLGLGLLTKLALAIFLPLAIWRYRHCVRQMGLLLLVTGVLMAPWLVHQVTTYGWADPLAIARHSQVVQDQARFPGLSTDYVAAALTTTFHSFWAQFGWMAIPAPDRLYWIWGALTIVAIGGLVWKRDKLDHDWTTILVLVGLTVLAYVGYNLSYLQLQGRYLFIGLVPMSALLVCGWSAWFPLRLQAPGALLTATGLVALNVYTLLRVLEPGFGH